MRHRSRLWALLPLALSLSCAPPLPSGEVPVYVVRAEATGEYALSPAQITVTALASLSGPQIDFLGRSRLVASFDEGGAVGAEMKGGQALSVDYTLHEGAWLASDFEGLVATTIYHHMSAALGYFGGLGVGATTDPLPPMTTHYLPSVELLPGLSLPVLTDNAGYSPLFSGFLIFDQVLLDALPLATNEGVIAHELSHAVFHHLTARLRGFEVPRYLREAWSDEATNTLRGLDEGLADVHGAAFTGDPNFIAPSVEGLDRDLAQARTFTPELAAALSEPLEGHNPYALGSVLASAFWSYREARRATGLSPAEADADMAARALEATLAFEPTPDASVAGFLEAAASACPLAQRPELCAAFAAGFPDQIAEVIACP